VQHELGRALLNIREREKIDEGREIGDYLM
jgi:hypothetical protein